ncbi:phage portal protein family protein [Chishuiella changwenlii]|uniref:phage portal protein family protein n=1 Tax=Chishuiella changwenlii TaxID=1434701 RepID=UPI002FDB4E70
MSRRNRLKANQKSSKQINISQAIVVKPPQRSNVGIEKWRNAMKQADRGRRAPLIELVLEIMDADPVFSEAWDKRVRAITNADIVFQVKGGKEVEAMMDLIDTTEFEETLKEAMWTKLLGKTVGELDFSNGYKFTLIDRRHLNTETKQIVLNQSDTFGISYENNDFLLNLGKDNDLGLAMKVIAYAIFKRNGGADYAQFCELFGIPQLAGLYDPDDEQGRQEMETAFKNRGSAGSIVMSKNGDIKTIGSETSGNTVVHDGFLKWCDEQILIGLIGQTMTTKDGASYSQSKTHGDTENDINKADRRYIQRILNEKLLPILEKRGYPVKGGWFSFPEKEKALSKKEQLEIAIEIDDRTEAGIDEKYWYENFGLPKGNRKANPEKVKETEEEEEPTDNPTEKKEKQKSASRSAQGKKVQAQELSFWNKLAHNLKDFFAGAPR